LVPCPKDEKVQRVKIKTERKLNGDFFIDEFKWAKLVEKAIFDQ
tara:strand:+ start:106 stop:237 length:132 start_codon:yes stop_codon:yes gene_type:complete